MGQKTNPIGNRLGIIRGWESNWYGGREFAQKLVQDEKIRNYLHARINKGGLARIIIERTLKRITITIHTSRPGIIIGKGGQEVDKLREELKALSGEDIQINIIEIRKPELEAPIVAESIAKQLESRVNYRRAVKMAIQSSMRAGALGIKVRVSGRLNGAEMARSEEYKDGRTPLHTFRADVDYSIKEALTVYGKLGIKVWLFRGEVLGKRDLSPNVGVAKKLKGNERGPDDRRQGGGDEDRRQGGGDRDRRPGGGDRDRRPGGGDRDRRPNPRGGRK